MGQRHLLVPGLRRSLAGSHLAGLTITGYDYLSAGRPPQLRDHLVVSVPPADVTA